MDFLEKLKSSGIPPQFNSPDQLNFSPDSIPEWIILKFKGFTIPYYHPSSPLNEIHTRFRYLEDTRNHWDKLSGAKQVRYTQPKNSHIRVYFPRLNHVNYSPLYQEVTQDTPPLIITEGELKAACGSINLTNYITIAVGGVSCYRDSDNPSLISDLEEIVWKNREVYLIFDSDYSSNPNVTRELNNLSKTLTRKGAKIHITNIKPQGKFKWGLDDWIVNTSKDEVEEVILSSPLFSTCRELYEFNEEVAISLNPAGFLDRKNKEFIRTNDFYNVLYSNRFIIHRSMDKKKNIIEKKVPITKEWVEWLNRATVNGLTYKPGQPEITEGNELNLWNPYPFPPKEGDITPWLKLVDFIFQQDKELIHYIHQWLAYPLQYPGTKLYTAIVIWGVYKGTGKSLIGTTICKIYGLNATIIGNEELTSSFNEWIDRKQFVMGDEITGSARREVSDKLKALITNETIQINKKFIPRYSMPCCANFYFTSNHPDAFYLEDGDRRYFIHKVTSYPLPQEFYKSYETWMNTVGPSHLLHFLLNYPLKDFEPHGHAMETESKIEMTESGRSELSTWVRRLRNEPDDILRIGKNIIPRCLWTAEELRILYDPDRRYGVTSAAMGRELARQGFEQVHNGCLFTTVQSGKVRLWKIRSTPIPPTKDEVAAFYDKECELCEKY